MVDVGALVVTAVHAAVTAGGERAQRGSQLVPDHRSRPPQLTGLRNPGFAGSDLPDVAGQRCQPVLQLLGERHAVQSDHSPSAAWSLIRASTSRTRAVGELVSRSLISR